MNGSMTLPIERRGATMYFVMTTMAALFLAGCGGAGGRMVDYNGLTELKVGGRTAHVSIQSGRSGQGLKFRAPESVKEDEGSLLVYPGPQNAQLTMQGMNMDLDVAFIDGKGIITDIHTMPVEAGQLTYKKYKSSGEVVYALQMKSGWFQTTGVKVGDEIPNLPSAR